MNIYASSQLQTASNPTSPSPLRRGLFFTALALVALTLLPAARAQRLASESDAFAQCSSETLKGTYMSSSTGTLNGLPITQVNRLVSDGNGSISGSGTVVVNGVVSFPVITATYTVNSDCTGTLTSVPAGLSQNFVIKDNGTQVFLHRDGPSSRKCHDRWRSGKNIKEVRAIASPEPHRFRGLRWPWMLAGIGSEAGFNRGPLPR